MKRALCIAAICVTCGLAYAGFVHRGRGYTAETASGGWTDPNESDLIVRYFFDPSVTNASGTVNDTSGNSHHGVLIPSAASGPVWRVYGTNQVAGANFGRVEHRFAFDGSEDRIDITNSSATVFNAMTNGFTITMWIERFNDDENEKIIVKSDIPGTSYDFIVQFNNTGTGLIRAFIYSRGNNAIYRGRTAPDFNSGSIVPLAVTYDGGNLSTGIHIYTNYTRVDTATIENGAFEQMENTTNSTIAIAEERDGCANFKGWIDDVRIYDRVLTTNELDVLFTNTDKPNNSNEDGY